MARLFSKTGLEANEIKAYRPVSKFWHLIGQVGANAEKLTNQNASFKGFEKILISFGF